MTDLLRLILPIYFIIYFGVAIVLKSVIVAKRTGKNPFVLPKVVIPADSAKIEKTVIKEITVFSDILLTHHTSPVLLIRSSNFKMTPIRYIRRFWYKIRK